MFEFQYGCLILKVRGSIPSACSDPLPTDFSAHDFDDKCLATNAVRNVLPSPYVAALQSCGLGLDRHIPSLN